MEYSIFSTLRQKPKYLQWLRLVLAFKILRIVPNYVELIKRSIITAVIIHKTISHYIFILNYNSNLSDLVFIRS